MLQISITSQKKNFSLKIHASLSFCNTIFENFDIIKIKYSLQIWFVWIFFMYVRTRLTTLLIKTSNFG